MANELKLAKAAREIARELDESPRQNPYPFGRGFVFQGDDKTPCCAIGHVIQRAGLSGLAKGRPDNDGKITFTRSDCAVADACNLRQLFPKRVNDAICDLVDANDGAHGAQSVAVAIYHFADVLELAAAPTGDKEE